MRRTEAKCVRGKERHEHMIAFVGSLYYAQMRKWRQRIAQKDRRGLSYFTIKISDEHYARANEAALATGVSVGQLIRQLLDKLPPVDADRIERWGRYRNRLASDKQVLSLDARETKADQIEKLKTALPGDISDAAKIRQAWEQAQKEALAEEAKEIMERSRPSRASDGLMQPLLSIIERAKLEERAAQGDAAAKTELRDDEIRREYQKNLTQL